MFNPTSAATSAIVVLYALEVLELGEAGFGVLLGLGALGGVVAAVAGLRAPYLLAGAVLLAMAVAMRNHARARPPRNPGGRDRR